MDGDILRLGWPCFQFQRLGLSGKIPIVVFDSPETDRGLYVLLVCCYVLCDALGNSKMGCRFVYCSCELILGVIAMNELNVALCEFC